MAESPDPIPSDVSLLRNTKIGTFHIGSSMADILVGGVWNRIAIYELGFHAFPISLILALRYLLAPLSVWVGQRSDAKGIFGYRRLPYIWGGRLLIVVSLMLLGISTLAAYENLEGSTGAALGWVGMIASVVLFSVGSAFSGTTFLALIHDVTPASQQTRVISVVWFFLISGFALSGVLYSKLLPTYTREGFLTLFISAPLIMAALWLFSIFGEERRNRNGPTAQTATAVRQAFWPAMREAWTNRQTRVFFLFLGLTTLFFYTQDGILEPFAAQVFGMGPNVTNRFSSYWGTMTLIGIVASLVLGRRFARRINNTSLSFWSVVILAVTFALFTVCAFGQVRAFVTIGLIALGVGLGAWTVGTLGLMMDMTRITGAGLYLSLWTVSETLARGLGTLIGGALHDLVLNLGASQAVSYGAVFLFQCIGFGLTLFVLRQVSVREFKQAAPAPSTVLEAAMD